MLTRFFGVFVNFTGENSRFLSCCFKCKHLSWVGNWRFTSPPCRFETQIHRGSQSRIHRWQNTIFGFLDAQLDFLAILSTPPHYSTKYTILSDSKGFNICLIITISVYLSVFYTFFRSFSIGGFFYLKNSKWRRFADFFRFFGF